MYIYLLILVRFFFFFSILLIAGSPQTPIMVHLLLILTVAFIGRVHGLFQLPSFTARGEWSCIATLAAHPPQR